MGIENILLATREALIFSRPDQKSIIPCFSLVSKKKKKILGFDTKKDQMFF